jgi:hypothetical protein
MDRDRLDLHALFEIGGNEPLYRVHVLDAIEKAFWKALAAPSIR